jgi:hypothetical protein
MKKASIAILLLFLLACNKGVWVTQNVYRPRHPRFAILKKPFNANALINNQFLYVSQRDYVSNAQKRTMYDFTGLYADGRVIGISLSDTELNKISEKNSWKTAPVIGHYTTRENMIEFEYFLPTNGGLYETRQGIIKKDTLYMKKFSSVLYKKENRYDTLVVSVFPLQE